MKLKTARYIRKTLILLLLFPLLPFRIENVCIPDSSDTLVALTIDDGYRSWLDSIDPILKEYNFPITGFINDLTQVEQSLTWDDIKTLSENELWEFGWHGLYHSDLTRLSDKEEERVIAEGETVFNNHSLPSPKTFSYPFGAYDFTTKLTVSNFFIAARSVQEGPNSAYWVQEHPMEIKVTRIYHERNIGVYKNLVSENIHNGKFIVFYLHAVGEPVAGEIEITIEDFKELIEWLTKQDVTIVSFKQGLEEMKTRNYDMKTNIRFDNPLQKKYVSAIPLPSRFFELTFASAQVLGNFNPIIGDLILRFNVPLTTLITIILILCLNATKSLIKRSDRTE